MTVALYSRTGERMEICQGPYPSGDRTGILSGKEHGNCTHVKIRHLLCTHTQLLARAYTGARR